MAPVGPLLAVRALLGAFVCVAVHLGANLLDWALSDFGQGYRAF